MALDKLTLLDETVVNNTATSTSNTIFTDRYITYKNKLINGNFDIWQRGTSFTNPANGSYFADRWQIVLVGGNASTRTVSRQPSSISSSDVPNTPSYYLRWNQTSNAGGTNLLRHTIENVSTLAGKSITVSFWARSSSIMNFGSNLFQYFGSGTNSPSSNVAIYSNSSLAISTINTWTRYSYTTTVPSISGKTIGNSNNDGLIVEISFPTNSTFTFDIAKFQLEEGTVATPFEERPIGLELSLCQRYYEVQTIMETSYSAVFIPGVVTAFRGFPVSFHVQKRRTPTIVYEKTGSNSNYWVWQSNFAASTNSLTGFSVSPNINGWYITQTYNSNGYTPVSGGVYQWEPGLLIRADAEL